MSCHSFYSSHSSHSLSHIHCLTCPLYRAIEKLSRKWSMHILRSFTEQKSLRFSEIMQSLPEINSRILSERLSELEEEELIERNVEKTKPITVTYKITEKGMELKKVFGCMMQWAKKWESEKS